MTEQLRAILTVTIETRENGDYYIDHDDLLAHVILWVEGSLEDRDDITKVTIAAQPPTGADTVADRAALTLRFGEVLSRWGLLDEVNDPKATMEFAVTDLLAVLPAPADRAAVLREVLPAWEAVYEPGNVSDYLIGYANDQDAATGMAEAWMRSQAEVTGRLEWGAWGTVTPMPSGYDAWVELVERHDDGVDTGPGIVVRRRTADEVPPVRTAQPPAGDVPADEQRYTADTITDDALDALYAELAELRAELAHAQALAADATEYRISVPESGGTELLLRRQSPVHGTGWAASVMARGGGRAWTTEGWQDSISALSVDRLFCWTDAATAVAEIRRALSAAQQ